MHLQAVVLLAKEIGKFFINRMEPFKFNISMMAQYKNLKTS